MSRNLGQKEKINKKPFSSLRKNRDEEGLQQFRILKKLSIAFKAGF
jgi:hypothetical protein